MEQVYNLVFCTDIQGGISSNDSIPWKIQEDSQYFRDLINTKPTGFKNIYIMGRKTYEQMQSLIKDNIVIVITSQIFNNIITVTDLDKIQDIVKNITDNNNIYKTFVLGGTSIYNYYFNNFKKYKLVVYWNLINYNYNCDNIIDKYIFGYLDSQRTLLISDVTINCLDTHNNNQIELIVHRPFAMNNSLKITEITVNQDEENYLRLMRKLLETGSLEKGRNGFTKSLFGNILEFNLNKFPLLTTKKTFLLGIFEELMFFIKGQTNAKLLSDKGVKIWDKNTSQSFINKCNLPYEEGDMGPMYGFQWRHFNAHYTGMNSDYSNKGFDQLSYVIHQLKTDPKSRRIIMTTFNPEMASQGVLFPCHGITIMFHTNFITDTDLTLDIMQTQRSCDYFLGVPFNIASYSLLVYMLCHVINNDIDCKYKYKPGKLVMNLGDYHLYQQHLEQAKKQILRAPFEFPDLVIKNTIFKLEDFKYEDIELVNYNCYPGIKAEMVE